MSDHKAGSELDFTDSDHRWSADGWCFTHSTEAGPVYCRQPIDPPWSPDATDAADRLQHQHTDDQGVYDCIDDHSRS